SWTCRQAELTRKVVITYPNEPAALPCKVYQTMPNNNAIPRTSWTAEHDDAFCKQKAIETLNNLETKGWECSSDSHQ
ncbi:MAG: hypothetical protein ABW098_14180, partial [Candidatus Thiodiazotropha sp.]